jgi:hypothetical protein
MIILRDLIGLLRTRTGRGARAVLAKCFANGGNAHLFYVAAGGGIDWVPGDRHWSVSWMTKPTFWYLVVDPGEERVFMALPPAQLQC